MTDRKELPYKLYSVARILELYMSLKYHSDTNKHLVSSQLIVNTRSHDTVLLGKDRQAEVNS